MNVYDVSVCCNPTKKENTNASGPSLKLFLFMQNLRYDKTLVKAHKYKLHSQEIFVKTFFKTLGSSFSKLAHDKM